MITKIKLKEKVVALIDYADDYIIIKKNDVFCLGELCRFDGVKETLLERYGDEYELEFTPEELSRIYEFVMPLSLWRDKVINDLLNEN